MSTRKVQVFTTKGQNKVGNNAIQIPEEVQTLSQLFPYLRENGVEYEGMKIMLVEGNLTLEHTEALLPTTDFMLSLTPVKTKAGADYATMKTYIKERRATAVANNEDGIVELIGDYTRMTKADMTDLYDQLQTGLEQVEVQVVCDAANNANDEVLRLKAEVLRLKTRINSWIDTIYDLEDETYEDVDDDTVVSVRQAEPEIPEAVRRLQQWAVNQ